MLHSLDAAAVRRWCAAGVAGLRRHRREIDALNVFPVPDGDTGTNLLLTLEAAQRALAEAPGATPPGPASGGLAGDGFPDAPPAGDRPPGEGDGPPAAGDGPPGAGDLLHRLARGALLGARGNSGVIVAQVLAGLAEALGRLPRIGGRDLADGLRAAATAAYAAVAEPVEGTVLSVVTAAADGAAAADRGDLPAVVRAAAGAAAAALARTPAQLPALARAGVVDAGGRGVLVLLDALVEVVTGGPAAARPGPGAGRAPACADRPGGHAPVAGPRRPRTGGRSAEPTAFAYEVQYLLDAPEPAVRRLREVLAGLGDSLALVGTGGDGDGPPTWNVHVHVNDVGAAIEAGVEAGRPWRISVTRFADQAPPAEPPARAVVVVASGAGLAALLRAEGATVVPANPSTAELLAAVRGTRATEVVILPNDPDARAVAAVAATEAHGAGVRVRVVPTRSPVQALAALAVRDPGRPFDDDVIAMAEAAGACRFAEVCHAASDALTVAGRCRPGDVLALVDGEVNVIGAELTRTCRELLDRLLGGGGELVTLLLGAPAPAGLADELRAHLARHWPFVEVQVYQGDQPTYPLLVGVE
ncbi:MAG TPA: DAK2 domain-containing protein [Pilimelia sp.]|nr:DAK2 domain-containing protein [Pilimelia sp.]